MVRVSAQQVRVLVFVKLDALKCAVARDEITPQVAIDGCEFFVDFRLLGLHLGGLRLFADADRWE